MSKRIVAVLGLLVGGQAAAEATYDASVDTTRVSAKAIEQVVPSYPGEVRSGQEGWVRLSFVVTPAGSVADPIVVDAVGGVPFENAAREALARWRFEPPADAAPDAGNLIDMRFEFRRGRDLATANFLRRYRRIMTNVHHERTAEARAELDDTIDLGGWNLYESTMLALMTGRVAGQEGDLFGKLENYRRALRIDAGRLLKRKDRLDLLASIFDVETELGQYAAAAATAERLRDEAGTETAPGELDEEIAAVRQAIESSPRLRASARLANACHCDDGVPVWSYTPVRRHVRFDDVAGRLDRFDARCDSGRREQPVVAGTVYELPGDAGTCELYVFGEDDTAFTFTELEDAGTAADARPKHAVGSGR